MRQCFEDWPNHHFKVSLRGRTLTGKAQSLLQGVGVIAKEERLKQSHAWKCFFPLWIALSCPKRLLAMTVKGVGIASSYKIGTCIDTVNFIVLTSNINETRYV